MRYPTQRYLYNGKELHEQLGLGWYDYGARWYDAAVGRFPCIDPLAERFAWVSPYNYAENEPIGHVDLWGLQKSEPIDFIVNYIKRKLNRLTYELITLGAKMLIEASEYLVEQKLDQAVNSDDPFTASVALTVEFLTGLGPEEREFYEGHPFTESLKGSNMTTEALKVFYKEYQRFLSGERPDVPRSYRVDFKYGLGDTGPFKEFFKDGQFTAAQFVGTALYTFTLDEGSNMLHIYVYDTKTEYSFLYHIPGTDRHSRFEGKIMGETTQHYYFSISLSDVSKRVEW